MNYENKTYRALVRGKTVKAGTLDDVCNAAKLAEADDDEVKKE